MKWMSIYLAGYAVFILGVILALWKLGVLEKVGPAWTAIGIVIAAGLGIMMSIRGSGEKKTIDVDDHR